ncbi:MAG: acyl-CoA dehydrogenase family protein [Chloroflexota bacterium]
MDFTLSSEQEMLRQTARQLARERFAVSAFQSDMHDAYPWDFGRLLADAGLTGINFPIEDGGQGGSMMDSVIVMEQVASVNPVAGDVIQATNFGPIRQLALFGSAELKQQYLTPLLRVEGLISIGMSEPEAGSAATELQTRARIDGDEIVINGQKLWNSNGPHATCVAAWVRFGAGNANVGVVLVPCDAPGFSKGPPERFTSGEQHCALYFDECRVPRGNMLIERDAFRHMFPVFNLERIGNATRALSLGQAAFEMCVEHALQRQQFGTYLADMQGIQWKLADMRMRLDAARLLIYRAASSIDAGRIDPTETAIAKCYANETGFWVANEALQIFGAMGYTQDSPLSYIFRRTRGWMIAGGTLEIQRNTIAAGILGKRPSRPKDQRQSS